MNPSPSKRRKRNHNQEAPLVVPEEPVLQPSSEAFKCWTDTSFFRIDPPQYDYSTIFPNNVREDLDQPELVGKSEPVSPATLIGCESKHNQIATP